MMMQVTRLRMLIGAADRRYPAGMLRVERHPAEQAAHDNGSASVRA
jgi:hypothetical protein